MKIIFEIIKRFLIVLVQKKCFVVQQKCFDSGPL